MDLKMLEDRKVGLIHKYFVFVLLYNISYCIFLLLL